MYDRQKKMRMLVSTNMKRCFLRLAKVAAKKLALVPSEAVVEVLPLRTLGPLGIWWLLAPAVASCALRAAVSHGLRSVPGRGLSGRTGKVAMLATVLTCDTRISYCRHRSIKSNEGHIPPYWGK